ncbi:MAG TPA: phosphatase PAP2 family protein [Pseudoneobacillus sp.]|nr:phosphatase PAP2 family protein [Pseudoneobacillus sp.]
MNKKYEKHFMIYSLLAGLIGLYLLYSVTHSDSLWIDRTVSAFFITSNSTILTIFDYITQLGYKIGIGTVTLLTIIWLWIKKKDYAGMASIALAVGLGNEVNKLLKNWIGRERPSLEHIGKEASLSFPSGHAMVGIILYMMLAYFLVKYIPSVVGKWVAAIGCILIILLLGISRLVLNVHYPSDIFAGYAFGFIWAFLWILIYEQLKNWSVKRG